MAWVSVPWIMQNGIHIHSSRAKFGATHSCYEALAKVHHGDTIHHLEEIPVKALANPCQHQGSSAQRPRQYQGRSIKGFALSGSRASCSSVPLQLKLFLPTAFVEGGTGEPLDR
eukprot:6189542-Pleurochrysis_carterae.AAC.2